MTWVSPLAGALLALAVIPPLVLLYFLRLRRKAQPISCTLLWKRSIEDLRANAPFQKLRRSLLLFLQLLALILLAASIMQPQVHAGSRSRGKTVMMIDNSASMTSTNVSPGASDATRLDEAKRRAKARIEAMYGGGLFGGDAGETMIIVFSDRAEIIARFTSSKQQLLAALDRIQPTHGETRIGEALKLARAYTIDPNPEAAGRAIADPATIELYSDGRIADLAEHVLRGETLKYQAVGAPSADNVSITALSVERPYDRPDAVEVFVGLANFNREPVQCDMQLSVNDRVRGIQEASVPAAEVNPATSQLVPGRANVVFTPFEQPRGAIIEIANLRADALAADNIAQVVVAPPSRLQVALVVNDPARSLVRKALEGIRLIERLEIMRPEQYEDLAARQGLDTYDAIVIDNYQPKALPAGRYLTFGPTPPVEGLNEFGEGPQQIILTVRESHPVMRFVTYDKVIISKFRLLQPARDVHVLMEGSRGPAAVLVSRGGLQVIHCPFDPLESNWPFERSFVTFIQNAVEFLGSSGESITNRSLKPGEAITARLAAGASDITLLTPDSAAPQRLSPADPSQLSWGPIRLSGPHLLTWKTPDGELHSNAYAVNLLSEAEGRIEMNGAIEIGQERVAARHRDESVYTPLWPWAIGVCLAVLMLEWWVYHRKAFI